MALIGVVIPGVGIVSAEAAAETTITFETVFHGYDAAVDVAAELELAGAVAGSGSAGQAVSVAINVRDESETSHENLSSSYIIIGPCEDDNAFFTCVSAITVYCLC